MPTKKRKHSRPFVMLDNETWQSKAWKELTGAAVKLYIVFTFKAFRSNSAMRSPFKISYREIRQLTGLSLQSIRRAIIQLENLGFIDFVEQGGLKSGGYGKKEHRQVCRAPGQRRRPWPGLASRKKISSASCTPPLAVTS